MLEQSQMAARQVDRQTIFKKIFHGSDVQYEDMFLSRGYRGMHIFPYPNHIIEQIS